MRKIEPFFIEGPVHGQVVPVQLREADAIEVTVKGAGVSRLLIDPATKLPAAGGVIKSASGQSVEVVARFSKWAKPVNLTPPTDAIAYSTATKS